MLKLNFSIDCASCGKRFSRIVQRSSTAMSAEPVRLYCRHCGCAHVVAQADGVAAEERPAPRDFALLAGPAAPIGQ